MFSSPNWAGVVRIVKCNLRAEALSMADASVTPQSRPLFISNLLSPPRSLFELRRSFPHSSSQLHSLSWRPCVRSFPTRRRRRASRDPVCALRHPLPLRRYVASVLKSPEQPSKKQHMHGSPRSRPVSANNGAENRPSFQLSERIRAEAAVTTIESLTLTSP